MNRRFRTLLRPDAAAPAPLPSVREGLCAWGLGLVWTLGCIWLADATRPGALPALLLSGVLVAWIWRYTHWLGWFPGVLATATLVQPYVPLQVQAGPVAVGITGMIAAGLLIIAAARAIAYRRRVFPNTTIDAPLTAMIVLIAIAIAAESTRADGLNHARYAFVGVVTFYAGTAVASVPGGTLKLWPVFPLLIAGIAGSMALSVWPGVPAPFAPWSDAGLIQTLAFALPPTIGLSIDAGRRRWRAAWRAIAIVGAVALAALLVAGIGRAESSGTWTLNAPLGFGRLIIMWTILLGLAANAVRVGRTRPREPARWIGLAAGFAVVVLIEAVGYVLDGMPVIVALATGTGITMGVGRVAARRASATAAQPARVAPGEPDAAPEDRKEAA